MSKTYEPRPGWVLVYRKPELIGTIHRCSPTFFKRTLCGFTNQRKLNYMPAAAAREIAVPCRRCWPEAKP